MLPDVIQTQIQLSWIPGPSFYQCVSLIRLEWGVFHLPPQCGGGGRRVWSQRWQHAPSLTVTASEPLVRALLREALPWTSAHFRAEDSEH